MADQIIIELIGDPSGLKPAEEALKELSKVSEENMAAFNKANEAAGKFAGAAGAAAKAAKSLAEGAKESAKAMESIGEAASKSITSISGLNAAIATGAMKAATEDIKSHSKEMKELNGTRTKLMADLKKEEGQYSKNSSSLQKMSADYKDQSARFDENKTKIEALSAAHKLFKDQQGAVKKELSSVNSEMDKMKGSSQEGSKAYAELAARSVELDKSIKGYSSQMGKTTKESNSLKTANNELSAEMSATAKSIKTTEKSLNKQKEAIDASKESIMKNAQETAKAILEHNSFYKSIGSGVEKMEHLKTVGESVTKGMKLFGVENEDVEKGMKKLSETIDFAKGAQSAMNAVSEMGASLTGLITTAETGRAAATGTATVATEGSTVAATAFGTAAESAWAAATLGVSVLIAGLVALVANFKAVKHWVMSIFGGSEIDEANKKLEETVKISKAHSEELKKQADTMEAQGKTAVEVNGIRQQQLQAEKDGLKAQLDLETDIEKKKEIQAQIDEKDLGLIRLQTEATKAKVDAEKAASDKKDDDSKKAEQAHAQRLTDAKTLADAKLAITTTGSKARLDAEIRDLNAAAAVELNNAKGNAELKDAINKKLQQDIAAANQSFRTAKLQDEKTGIEAQLALTKEGTKDELDLKYDLLDKEAELVKANSSLTVNERMKALNEITAKQKELADQAAKHQSDLTQTDITIQKTVLQTKLINEKLNADERYKIQQELIKLEAQAQKEAIKASTKDEKQKAEEIKQIDAQLAASTRSGMDAEVAARLDAQQKVEDKMMEGLEKNKANLKDKLAALNDEKKAELKIIDDMLKAGTISTEKAAKEREKIEKKATNDITKAKEEAAKKEQDMEKQLAAAAINMAKQVADAIFAAAEEKRQQALASTISTLESQKSAELSNHHLTATQKAAIEKKFQKEEALAKEKAWKADQKAKAEQAIINGLLAFTMTMAQQGYPAGLVTGLIALAQAGVQAGIILAKHPPKFAKGVVGLDGPGTETSDSIAAYLSKGESVITAERTRQYRPVLEQIHAGIYEPLPIPMLSTLPRLHDLSGVHPLPLGEGRGGAFDYDKLGRAVAKNIPSPVVNSIRMDENGFSKSILKKGNKTEYYNSKMKF